MRLVHQDSSAQMLDITVSVCADQLAETTQAGAIIQVGADIMVDTAGTMAGMADITADMVLTAADIR
jgi:hypothetical protein